MHNSSNLIQDENGVAIPNILRDSNGAILVNDNSAFYRAYAEAERVKADANRLRSLGVTVEILTTEISEIKNMMNLILQKLNK